MATHNPHMHRVADETNMPPQKIRKKRIYEFPTSFWSNSSFEQGEHVAEVEHDKKHDARDDLPDVATVAISEHSTCNTCNMSFESHVELRFHTQSDHHRFNLRRKLKNRPPINEDIFEKDFMNLSDGSLSGSGEDDSDDDEVSSNEKKQRSSPNVKLQFADPDVENGYIVVYKAALPDQTSLRSFGKFGYWAVIMAGGGHFSAAVWNEQGEILKHKSFHRYTTRRKQGGAQSAADASKKGIKSAGSTLRRYGEQALQLEVRSLLTSWSDELRDVQCVFLRVNKRDRRDLLFGWDDSPLAQHKENGICRNIPFQTRRATFKEVQRVYEQLSTVILSPISLIKPVEEEAPKPAPKSVAPNTTSSKSSSKPKVPVEKGTAHLKKREPKPVKLDEPSTEKPKVELNTNYIELIKDIVEDNLAGVQERLDTSPELKAVEFEVEYFRDYEKLASVQQGCGLVAVAAASGSLTVLGWLLLEQVPLFVGLSPYLVTKAKRVRTFLRKFWGKYPELHDYEAAGIPGPLSEADLAASAQKEREKRKRDREKKKEKEFLAAEAAKPPAVRARELRAAAAEARMLGNRCVVCKKSLDGLVPFERLTYKYCSVECCTQHRKILSKK